MAVTLTHSRTGDVAVVTVSGEQTLEFLCRSLTAGAAFANYPALLLDLRAVAPLDADTREALERATHSCLNRKQWLGIVNRGDNIPQAVARARQWHRLVHRAPTASRGSARAAARTVTGVLRTAAVVVRETAPARARTPR